MVRQCRPFHDAGITIVERLLCLVIHDDTAVALGQYAVYCCRCGRDLSWLLLRWGIENVMGIRILDQTNVLPDLRETSNVGTARSDRIVIIRRAVQYAVAIPIWLSSWDHSSIEEPEPPIPPAPWRSTTAGSLSGPTLGSLSTPASVTGLPSCLPLRNSVSDKVTDCTGCTSWRATCACPWAVSPRTPASAIRHGILIDLSSDVMSSREVSCSIE